MIFKEDSPLKLSSEHTSSASTNKGQQLEQLYSSDMGIVIKSNSLQNQQDLKGKSTPAET
jgi:hypothetical protein